MNKKTSKQWKLISLVFTIVFFCNQKNLFVENIFFTTTTKKSEKKNGRDVDIRFYIVKTMKPKKQKKEKFKLSKLIDDLNYVKQLTISSILAVYSKRKI